MFSQSVLATGIVLAAYTHTALAVDKTVDPSLDESLAMAPTQLDRMALRPEDSDWHFDFTKSDFYTFAPGGVVNMNAATFPASKGNGLTLAMLNLGPCSMLPPHYHPRASNYVVSVKGTTTTYMFAENGAKLVTEELPEGHGTIFPQGSMHMMVNNACENAQLVSALSSEDAGTQNIGNVFTNGFPADLVNAAFSSDCAGNETAAKMTPIGTGSNSGTAECMARCNIKATPKGRYVRF